MAEPVRITLDYAIHPDQTWQYLLVPFEVPLRVSRIDIAYTYEGAISSDPEFTGGNTIDIGIFDARGAHWMSPGFRGWSGSARDRFYLAEDSATPGYMPGPIQPGTWHICLGAYKVAPDNCHCKLMIDLSHSERAEAAHPPAFPERIPLRTTSARPAHADGWYKGELHCHTVHSDGDFRVEEVVHDAETLGLDFLAITDHNVQSHQVALTGIETNLILIPGCEVTTYYGHWNIWGSGPWIDFRVKTPADLKAAIETALAEGYLVSCNHPRPYGPEWAFAEVDGYACVETWNGPWIFLNDVCRTFWEDRLMTGQRLVAVGGSDFHNKREDYGARLGQPTVYIHCPDDPSAAKLLENLRAGHAFVTESPSGPRLDLRAGSAMMGDQVVSADPVRCTVVVTDGVGTELQFCSATSIVSRNEVTQPIQSFDFIVDPDTDPYVRAQLVEVGSGRCLALTNPIYLSSPQ